MIKSKRIETSICSREPSLSLSLSLLKHKRLAYMQIYVERQYATDRLVRFKGKMGSFMAIPPTSAEAGEVKLIIL